MTPLGPVFPRFGMVALRLSCVCAARDKTVVTVVTAVAWQDTIDAAPGGYLGSGPDPAKWVL